MDGWMDGWRDGWMDGGMDPHKTDGEIYWLLRTAIKRGS